MFLTHSFALQIQECEFGLKKLEPSYCGTVGLHLSIFLNRLGVTHECDRRTDGQRDGHTLS